MSTQEIFEKLNVLYGSLYFTEYKDFNYFDEFEREKRCNVQELFDEIKIKLMELERYTQ